MNQGASICKYTNIDKRYSIEDLAAFHGHLGPYIVLGYRIGRYAKQQFCSDPFQMKATVFCEGVPPQSCLADGVQIGSGCTLGKRNIEIVSSSDIKCEFTCGERKIAFKPKQIDFPQRSSEDYSQLIENLAAKMYSMQDSELFEAVIT